MLQFAFDTAEGGTCPPAQLGNLELSYLQFGYLAGKEGLLAGEKLYLDIKRMEMAYHELNRREYELTKHVSLLQVNPLALLQFTRRTGRCTVSLPEEVFDMDGPGHYFRRIKAVGVSIPCVTGPYASVNCTLTLLKSSDPQEFVRWRRTAIARDGRRRQPLLATTSAVCSPSSQAPAQSDSGLFETNLRDERICLSNIGCR